MILGANEVGVRAEYEKASQNSERVLREFSPLEAGLGRF